MSAAAEPGWQPPRLSACIIAQDEADRIGACLESVAFADEILVLDSGSRDGTPEICRRAGARVVETDWPGWVRQKQRAVEMAQHDWILSVDADERVDAELSAAIQRLRARDLGRAGEPTAYAVRRRVRFLGRWIAHGGWYPEWRTRLFDRRAARWEGTDPHDHVRSAGSVLKVREGHLEHHTWRSMEDFLDKTNRFSTVSAQEKHRRGERAGTWDLVMRPAFRFWRMYLLRAGLLDGRPGLILALLSSYSVFLKYAKLWNLNRQEREERGAGGRT